MVSLEPRGTDALGRLDEAGNRRLSDFAVAREECRARAGELPADAPLSAMVESIAFLAATARRVAISPEDLLLTLKDLVAQSPQYESKLASDREEMMRDVVTLAVRSYFADKAD